MRSLHRAELDDAAALGRGVAIVKSDDGDVAEPGERSKAAWLMGSVLLPGAVVGVMERLGVVSFSLTVTLGYRVRGDGSLGAPIENRGVEPHIAYAITGDDLAGELGPMRAAIVDALQAAAR